MAKPQLGTKRGCAECSTKFYDLGKDPIVCPKCGTVFQIAKLSRAARADTSGIKPVQEEADAGLPEDEAVLVSLEDAEAEQASTGAKAKTAVDGDDIDDDIEDSPDDDDDDDDTFLEEDDEDPNVSDLIDGDIEGEEET